MTVEYNSRNIIILSDFDSNNEIVIVAYYDDYHFGLQNTKMVTINTFTDGLTNNDVKEAIVQVLNNTGCDIEYEIELYSESRLYNSLLNN